ncbi:LTA synthase family protein [Vibrio gallaecicus]|uniref:LTA synthase family protein n=1 Tax=Vibrio gallaecicus TaxID=552386 RepID=UPI0010C9E108|nr:LTA synthase family protein [Vibrio gallaecicus]MDN3614771.1 LTA synthase family protein [Vibrio gallaecicus]
MIFSHNYRSLSRITLIHILSGVLLLFLARALFFIQAVEVSQLTGLSSDVWRAFFVGARFDLKIVAIAFAPIFLFGLFTASFSKIFSRFIRVIPAYSGVIFFLLAGVSIANYYYYVTYGSYFDVFVFGLVDDDTKAVLSNAWADFPILRSFFTALCIAISAYISSRYLLKISSKWQFSSRHWAITIVSVIVAIAVYVVAARGSVGSLPLKRYHANVSQYKVLNIVTPNAFMALDWAKSDYKKQSKFEPISDEAVEAQMVKVLGQPTPVYQTPKNDYLADNPPHVVMALMEGMGNNILIEDDKETNDLLGSLREGFESDFVFKRFMAGTSATIDSIVMMLFHSDIPTISHSSAQKKVLPSSAVLPYKEAGYDVVFIYGGNSMWRNLSNYLPRQGFDKVYDENSIKKAFPDAEEDADTWGVPDEYTFKFARKLLDESNKPLMVYIMTVTNHSPFRAPDYYQAQPVKVSERLNTLLGPMQDQGEDLLKVYQYSSDSLGAFVKGIKASVLGDKTVIAASGDHRMRYLTTDSKDEFGLTFGVPLYMYVPDSILKNTEYSFDRTRIGSHRDIFPTLYSFSLSDQSYISLGGENLLSAKGISNIGYNNSRTIKESGAYSNANPEQLYSWNEHSELLSNPQSELNEEPEWGSEYRKLQNYYLRSQIIKQ